MPPIAATEPARRDNARPLVQRVGIAFLATLIITAVGTFAVDLSTRSSSQDAPATSATAPVAGPASAPAGKITIAGFKFDPLALTVAPDAEIKVTNQDQAKHTVTSGTRDNPDGKFDVKVDGGATGSVPGLPAGSYTYFCAIHPGMKGTFEVKAT